MGGMGLNPRPHNSKVLPVAGEDEATRSYLGLCGSSNLVSIVRLIINEGGAYEEGFFGRFSGSFGVWLRGKS